MEYLYKILKRLNLLSINNNDKDTNKSFLLTKSSGYKNINTSKYF